jgi:predicted nucleic acid-binding Zn ribbon protein
MSKEQGMAKKKVLSKGQQRSLRTQQIVMGVIGVLVVLAMVLSLIVR